jgi:hypothetical protein
MRDRDFSDKEAKIWRILVLSLFAIIIGGGFWAVNKYVPPQHLFWKPLDTNRPLGFASKQQLFALNLKSSRTCMNLVRDTVGFNTVVADPKRPTTGAGKGVCGWDVARVVYGTDDVLFAPGESNMQCPLSVAVFLWQREVDALARKHFDQPLAKIHHYGSYSCRRQRGNGSGNWSEHAFANAWDVASFELEDGTLIGILKDWDGERKKANFLREARKSACGIFRVTLSPDYNAAHRDHFHLDMGPGKSCR